MHKTLILSCLCLLAACSSKPESKSPKVISFRVEPLDPIDNPYQKDMAKDSLLRETSLRVGQTTVAIRYYSPKLPEGKPLWGGVVPYGEVWGTQMPHAPAINFERSMKINGQWIAAGTYGIFVIPSPKKWTVLLNHHWKNSNKLYDETAEVLRFSLVPQVLSDTVWRLTFQCKPQGPSMAKVVFMWENVQLAFPIEEAE